MSESIFENNRLLVIDDDSSIRDFYRLSLIAEDSAVNNRVESLLHQAAGLIQPLEEPVVRVSFEVDEASQGLDGIELARQALVEGRPYACAFIDMRMPPGIDGHETARRLRALDEQIFIIIVTAYSDTSIEQLQQDVRHDLLYTSKPISPDQLYQFAYNACVSWQRTDALQQLQNELEEKVRMRTEEIERLSEQAQFAAFQAGLVEMNSSVIHNIGNAVGGMGGLSWKLERELKAVQTISKGLNGLELQCEETAADSEMPENLRKAVMRHTEVVQSASDALQMIAEVRLQKIAETIAESVEYIKEVVTLQQAAAKPDSHGTFFRLNSLVEDAETILKDRFEQQGIKLEKQFDTELGEVQLPRNQLLQLLINLLKNSLEAIVQRKEQETTVPYTGEIEVSIERLGSDVLLLVSDNGIGCAMEHQEQLFTAGYTDKKQGSGLGLHSAANFVQSTGGTIDFQSAGREQGATVKVRLPTG